MKESIELLPLLRTIGIKMHGYCDEIQSEDIGNVTYKLKARSSDAIAFGAEGSGSIDPRDAKWAYGKAHASLVATKELYRHACDVGLLSIDPETMVTLDDAIRLTETEIKTATQNIPEWYAEMNNIQKGVKL